MPVGSVGAVAAATRARRRSHADRRGSASSAGSAARGYVSDMTEARAEAMYFKASQEERVRVSKLYAREWGAWGWRQRLAALQAMQEGMHCTVVDAHDAALAPCGRTSHRRSSAGALSVQVCGTGVLFADHAAPANVRLPSPPSGSTPPSRGSLAASSASYMSALEGRDSGPLSRRSSNGCLPQQASVIDKVVANLHKLAA